MIALLPPQGVTSRQTDLLQQVGWEIQYVDLLQLPSHSRAVTWRFRDMLTKLHAFVSQIQLAGEPPYSLSDYAVEYDGLQTHRSS